MRKWWQQLWCYHIWNLDLVPIVEIVYGKGFLKAYTCTRCQKEIHRFNDPINFIERETHTYEDKMYTVSPPIIKSKKEPQ